MVPDSCFSKPNSNFRDSDRSSDSSGSNSSSNLQTLLAPLLGHVATSGLRQMKAMDFSFLRYIGGRQSSPFAAYGVENVWNKLLSITPVSLARSPISQRFQIPDVRAVLAVCVDRYFLVTFDMFSAFLVWISLAPTFDLKICPIQLDLFFPVVRQAILMSSWPMTLLPWWPCSLDSPKTSTWLRIEFWRGRGQLHIVYKQKERKQNRQLLMQNTSDQLD